MITSLSGSGAYPHYHALWHLQRLGVIDSRGRAGELWRTAAERHGADDPGVRATRVALLDNSVAAHHPNLDGAIDTARSIDFVAARLGAFPARHDAETFEPVEAPSFALRTDAAEAARELAASAGPAAGRLVEELLERLAGPADEAGRPALAATRSAFSAHGTAMAGLIGARPREVPAASPAVSDSLDEALRRTLARASVVLPYAGVDPFCRLVPVATSFDPDPEQYALALLYAVLVEADVIVLARDFPDPFRASPLAGGGTAETWPRSSLRAPPTDEEESHWAELASLLEHVSRRVPILCAAGNANSARAIYPASLSSDANGIVSVGAFTADGHVAGYSASGAAVDLLAPSGDGERLDRELQRLDPLSRTDTHTDPVIDRLLGRVDPAIRREAASTESSSEGASSEASGNVRYCSQDLIGTDVPGAFGYNRGHTSSSVADAAVDDPASCYCRFGGTSGAVAVAAGYLSLLYSSGRLARGGGDAGLHAKRALTSSGIDAHVVGSTRAASPDGS